MSYHVEGSKKSPDDEEHRQINPVFMRVLGMSSLKRRQKDDKIAVKYDYIRLSTNFVFGS